MKVIIAGSRIGFSSLQVYNFIEWFVVPEIEITEVVSGKASGVDKFGELWAEVHNIPVKPFPADWKSYGNAAGPIRNEEMAKYADGLIAFCKTKSKGTTNMIKQAERYNLRIFKVEI
jgi:hypothetical protein